MSWLSYTFPPDVAIECKRLPRLLLPRYLSEAWKGLSLVPLTTPSKTKRVPRFQIGQDAVDITKSAFEGQGDAHLDAVCTFRVPASPEAYCTRGLDNAGKTTIVKKIMNEDVNSVSPTLGFIIKTIEYDGYV